MLIFSLREAIAIQEHGAAASVRTIWGEETKLGDTELSEEGQSGLTIVSVERAARITWTEPFGRPVKIIVALVHRETEEHLSDQTIRVRVADTRERLDFRTGQVVVQFT